MRRHLLDFVVLLVVATVVGGYLLLAEPSWWSSTLRAYVFAVGALAMLALVSAASALVPRTARSQFDLALTEAQPEQAPLRELERLQREVTLSTAAAFDLHFRLLPQLREIAQARLERTGHSPGPDTLGRWWELLRPDREAPEERFGHGIPLRELRELVRDLERIG
jgi:hypothetical protein